MQINRKVIFVLSVEGEGESLCATKFSKLYLVVVCRKSLAGAWETHIPKTAIIGKRLNQYWGLENDGKPDTEGILRTY